MNNKENLINQLLLMSQYVNNSNNSNIIITFKKIIKTSYFTFGTYID